MFHATALTGVLLLLASSGMAQTETAPTEFEVASVKPYVPPAPQANGRKTAIGKRGGPGSGDPGQITWNGASLKSLIVNAYAVKDYQVSGPAWLDTERFTIMAKVPAGATREQVLVMWQNLLAQRFQLKLHRETKEIPIYEITVGKNGPKLKESAPDPPPSTDPAPKPPTDGPPVPVRITVDDNGCPVFPGGARMGTTTMIMAGRFRMCARKMTMEGLSNMLTSQLNRPLFDKTGLKGTYDFKLEFEPEGQAAMMGPAVGAGSAAQGGPPPEGGAGTSNPNMEPAPPLSAALQNQLGLKLEAKKAPAEMLIVDKVEKIPSDN